MADIKISQLGAALAVNDSDLLPIVSNGNTLKAPASLVKNYAVGNTDLSGIGDGTPTGAIAALNTDKQPKTLATPITVDDTPQTTVEGALGAINTDLGSTKQALTNYENVCGAKNLLPRATPSGSVVSSPVTYTVGNDGSIIADSNGTAVTANNAFPFFSGKIDLPSGTYLLNGCPSGGTGKYRISIIITNSSTNGVRAVYDYGDSGDVQFTLSDVEYISSANVYIVGASGNVITNKKFYPMVRISSISDDTYVPYAKTNNELTDNVESEEGTITFNTANFTNNSSWVYKFGKTVSLQVAGTLQSTVVGSNIELMTLPFTVSNVSSVSIPIGENGYATVSVMDNKVYIYTSVDSHGWAINANLTFLTS